MSIEAVAWALSVPVGGNEKIMLLGLANHAHPDGSETYPSLDTLATYGSCDRSTARRNVRKLCAAGLIVEDGKGPRGTDKYRLQMGGGDSPPVAERNGGTATSRGVAPVPPEPSIEPKEGSSSSSQEALTFDDGVTPEMREDAAKLLKRKVKVGGHVVTPAEMAKAAAAVSAFNAAAGSDYGLGAHLTPVVGRIRERPSYDAPALVRLVQSAWRLKWWERNGRGGRRATPAVIFGNSACFENVVQDATDEKAGKSPAEVPPTGGGRFRRTKAREEF
jgi:hypothetical protein